MNHLHYNLITDKRLKRHIGILDVFQHSPYPLTLEEIATEISVSRKTVSTDIKSLNDLFPSNSEIKSTASIGVQLIWNATITLDSWLEHFLANEPLFIIVHALFNDQHFTMEEWADKLFLSDTTMRKNLRLLDRQLQRFNLKLVFSPLLTISGKEVDKRIFFFQFFRGFNHSLSLSSNEDFTKLFSQTIHNLVTNYQENLELELHLDINRVVTWLKVISKRISLENQAEVSKKDISLFFERDVQKNFSALFVKEAQLNLAIPAHLLTNEEQIFFYATCLDSVIYNGGLDFEKRIFSYEDDKRLYVDLSEFSTTLIRQFHFNSNELPYTTKMLATINAFLRNMTLLTKITPLFQKNSFDINQQIKHIHPMSYEKCLKLVSSSPILIQEGIVYYEDISVSLIMLLYSFIPTDATKKTNILFSLTGESTYLNYVMTLAKSIIPSSISIFFDTDEENLPVNFKPAVCIYNQNVHREIPNCHMIKISSIPQLKDWTLIYNLITDISSKEFHTHFEL